MSTVEVRLLSGDSVVLENCHNVGDLTANVAQHQGCVAHSVAVIDPKTGAILRTSAAPPPVVSVLLLGEDIEVERIDLVGSFALHAQNAHVRTCLRILGMADVQPMAARAPDSRARRDLTSYGTQQLRTVAAVRRLLRAGIWEGAGYALQRAAARGDGEVVQLLLDVGMIDDVGAALGAACAHGHASVAARILASGVRETRSELPQAVRCSREKVVRVLLNAGCRLGSVEALKIAADLGNENIVKMLLDAGVQDVDGAAFLRASENGDKKIMRLFLPTSPVQRSFAHLWVALELLLKAFCMVGCAVVIVATMTWDVIRSIARRWNWRQSVSVAYSAFELSSKVLEACVPSECNFQTQICYNGYDLSIKYQRYLK